MVDQALADSFAKELGFSEYASVSKEGIAITCDGVGTKLLVAEHFHKFDTIGIDLVAMSANDLLCSGSQPARFMDYYATGKLDLNKSREIITGIKEGCRLAGCKLAGGETAQLKPMFKQDHWFDLAGFMIGYQRQEFDYGTVRYGDTLVGIPSSGVHSNGFTTLRNSTDTWDIEWLNPTRIYTREIMDNLDFIKGVAHITGGGLHGNIPRIIGDNNYHITAELDPWWEELRESLSMSKRDLASTFNCGWGMVIVTDKPLKLNIPGAEIIGGII